MNRSRSGQCGALGSNLRCFSNRTVATSAMPIGMPEWPELAAATASNVKVRMAVAFIQWSGWAFRSAAISKVIRSYLRKVNNSLASVISGRTPRSSVTAKLLIFLAPVGLRGRGRWHTLVSKRHNSAQNALSEGRKMQRAAMVMAKTGASPRHERTGG